MDVTGTLYIEFLLIVLQEALVGHTAVTTPLVQLASTLDDLAY